MQEGSLSNGTSGEADVSVLDEKKPDLTEKEAKEVNVVLGWYTTEFGIDGSRDKNIEIAAKSIKGVYVKPGESFSYNQATGARSKENGYQEAPVIINGKLEPGIGGGVCQVSTTLFNAALLSGLEITQRANHYSPIHYAPIGRDATVAEGIIDFAFHNDLKHGVYLYSDYTPGSVTIYILGNREDKPSYVDISTDKNDVIPNKTKTKIDPSQKENKKTDEGHDGRHVVVTQNVKWADGRTYHDTFYSDYDPVDTVITYKSESDRKADEDKAKSEGNDKTE